MPNETIEQSVNFDAIKIGLASPERIREWSKGEVKKNQRRLTTVHSNQSVMDCSVKKNLWT